MYSTRSGKTDYLLSHTDMINTVMKCDCRYTAWCSRNRHIPCRSRVTCIKAHTCSLPPSLPPCPPVPVTRPKQVSLSRTLFCSFTRIFLLFSLLPPSLLSCQKLVVLVHLAHRLPPSSSKRDSLSTSKCDSLSVCICKPPRDLETLKVGMANAQKGVWPVLERQERQLEGPLEDSRNFTHHASSLYNYTFLLVVFKLLHQF